MLTKEELEGLVEMAGAAEELKPIVRLFIDKAKLFTPELLEVFDGMRSEYVKARVKSFYQYMELGLTRQEALHLIINDTQNFGKSLKDINIWKGK